MGIGEFFALASAINWAVAVMLYKRSGETMSPMALNLFKNILTTLLMTLTVVAVHGFHWPMPTSGNIGLIMISGVIGVAIADNLYFHALNTIGAGRTGIVSSIYSPSVIVLSILFLGERLAGLQVAGFALVMAGIMMISTDVQFRRSLPRAQLINGLLIGALAVILMGVGVVMIKSILEQADFLVVVELRFVSGILAMLLLVLVTGKTSAIMAEYRRPHHWRSIVLASLIGSYAGSMLWLAGYKYAMASVAAVLNETASIFILILAWLWLKESLSLTKMIAIGLTFSGVLLMVIA